VKSPLHILHLEDDPNDAALVQATLSGGGIVSEIEWVQNEAAFVAALERGGVDLIISDYMLPGFNGMAGLAIVRADFPQIPLIFVSGTLGEERAVDSLKSGATDYVLKDRLARLAPAVVRAMQEVDGLAAKSRIEETLRKTEQRFRAVFNESPLGIVLVGKDGRPSVTNTAMQRILGYTNEELCRMRQTDFAAPEDREKDAALYAELIEGERAGYQIEERYVRKDGGVIWVRLSASLANSIAGDPGFSICMVEDITAQRELEAKFIEAQKMEVVGQLASGVAHDFNNIMAVIMGYSDLMTQKMVPPDEFKNCLETIRSVAERATGLTRQLLIFSRKQTVQLIVLDINEVVKDLDKMLRRLVDENIAMTIVPGREIGRIKADSGYIGQVLMNLVVNARDAMPNGGRLTIATENVTIIDSAFKSDMPDSGQYVMMSVTDTGTGMTEAVKARLFEAFFTTKPKGKGTGLGLATCHTIVQQLGGHIQVQSELGRGTTFRVYFPRVDQPVDTAARPHSGPAPRGTETLLVVEDEPVLRHLARSVLETQGYQVVVAPNGQEALHMVRNHKGPPIRLVISDVIMPMMGGVAMAEWLKTAHPDLKILFTSGYTEEPIMDHESFHTGVEFLPKPYTPAVLACKVREMLDDTSKPDIGRYTKDYDETPIAG
jgi:hypothetical protein